MIPLSIPNFEGNELKYVTDAVAQGWVSTGGSYITALEKKVAEFVNAPKAVACQSGTAALHLSLMECGVEAGELVIAPTLTFIAAVNPIRYMGAEPVFIDCDDSLCIDPVKLCSFCENECTSTENGLIHKETGKRIRAIIVVHVFGNMADMEHIMEIAARYQLKVVEDATEALGTRYTDGIYAGQYAGMIGDFGAYSFNGNKIITTGGGGMVVSRNQEALAHIQHISTQAKEDPLFYVHDEVGYNYRMTNVQAAIGVAQMELLSTFIERKNQNYDRYCLRLAGFEEGKLKSFRRGTFSNKWFYALEVADSTIDMRTLVNELSEGGVQTRTIWGLIHQQKPYQNCIAYQIEQAEYYSKCILNLPCSTNLTEDEIIEVCKKIRKVIGMIGRPATTEDSVKYAQVVPDICPGEKEGER